MKKLAMLLSLIAMVALTTNVFAQEKGQIQFGLGGYLFASEKAKASGAKAISAITPNATVRYFVADKIGIDGGLSIVKYGGDPAKALGIDDLGFTLLLGGRYYYWGQEKMKLNGGLDFEMFMGDYYKTCDDKGKEKSPMSLYFTPAYARCASIVQAMAPHDRAGALRLLGLLDEAQPAQPLGKELRKSLFGE